MTIKHFEKLIPLLIRRFPMSHQNDTYGCNFPRIMHNPSVKSGGGIVGPRNDVIRSTDTTVAMGG